MIAFAAEWLALVAFRGFFVALHGSWLVPYLALGCSLALFEPVVARMLRRRPATGVELVAEVTCVICAMALGAALTRFPSFVALRPLAKLAIALGAASGALVLAIGLASLARQRAIGAALGAASTTIWLVGVREQIFYSLGSEALGLFAAVALVAVGVALALRLGLCSGRTAAVAAPFAIAFALWWSAAPDVGDQSNVPSRPSAIRPSVVVMLVDTLRYDVLSDVLAGSPEGRRFSRALGGTVWLENAVAASPWTTPSVGSLFTGRYPQEHGFLRRHAPDAAGGDTSWLPLTPLRADVPTLAEAFARQGYWTEAIVTNPHLTRASGIVRGFARFQLLDCGAIGLPLLSVGRSVWPDGCLDYEDARHVGAVARRRLASWAAAEQPVFAWVHWMDPHRTYYAHPHLEALAGRSDAGEPEQLYRDEVRYLLGELAEWVEAARASGLLERSVFVLVADHGEMFPSDGHESGQTSEGLPKRTGHGHALYDELVRIPWLVRLPGADRPARRVAQVASHIDFAATIAGLAGIDPPAGNPAARSLVPLIVGAPKPVDLASQRTYAISTGTVGGPVMHSVRDTEHKLIVYPNGERPDEYYDLRADPAEHVDRAADFPERVAETAELLAGLGEGDLAPVGRPVQLTPERAAQLEALGYAQ